MGYTNKNAKNLYLMCGVPGSGKSTWCKDQIAKDTSYQSLHVSRDIIRFALVDESDAYFSKEDDVFNEFIREIAAAIRHPRVRNIYVDATHLNEKSRNKVLDRLPSLGEVNVIPVNFLVDINTILKRNNMREGRSRVPEDAVLRMQRSFQPATTSEKYSYNKIINVKE